MPIKTDKAALVNKFEEAAYKHAEKERLHVHVIYGNLLFHSLTKSQKHSVIVDFLQLFPGTDLKK